ncbi:MAG: PAS domain S-box protein [Nitrospiraceae bacterium]|nr:PAS domain S-box protein [Nitrospiraceae bacterium]
MANRRTISLRTKISAVTTLTIIVVALMLGALNTYNQLSHIRKFEERFLRDSVRSASAISHAIMAHLVSNDFVAMNNLVVFYSKRSDRLYVLVVDNNSRILADSEEGKIGGTFQSLPAYKTEKIGQGTIRRFMRSGKGAVEVSYPVKAGDLIVGNIVMGLNMDWMEEETGVIRKTMMASTGIALVVIFLGILLTSALADRISRPIRLLTQAAEKVGGGDYSQRINVKSNDEVGLLADTFDAMLGQLRNARMHLVEKDYLDSILATMRDALIVADPEGRIEMVNKATLNLLGYREDELVTRQLRTIISDAQPGERGIEDLIRQGLIGDDVEISLLSRDGRKIPVLLSRAVLENKDKVMRIVCVAKDVSERKRAEEQITASLREKEILLKEVHHRVKNNLQVVASMLNLQSRYLEDRKAKAMFEDSQRRIESMSLIHEKLYRSKDLARIDFREYIDDLLGNVTALNGGSDRLVIREDIGEVILDVNKGIPCGLIINELVSNALRHAFPDGRQGIIEVRMQSDSSGGILLIVSDNGAGFPEYIDFRNTKSLGMQLVTSLVSQLDGTIELGKSEGTAFTINFHT